MLGSSVLAEPSIVFLVCYVLLARSCTTQRRKEPHSIGISRVGRFKAGIPQQMPQALGQPPAAKATHPGAWKIILPQTMSNMEPEQRRLSGRQSIHGPLSGSMLLLGECTGKALTFVPCSWRKRDACSGTGGEALKESVRTVAAPRISTYS